jgi:hypothetical protein
MDVFSPQKRSEVMSRIRGRDTKPELAHREQGWHVVTMKQLLPLHAMEAAAAMRAHRDPAIP